MYRTTALAGPARRRHHGVSDLVKVVKILDGGLLRGFRGAHEASLDVPDEHAGFLDHAIGHTLDSLSPGKRLEHLGVAIYLVPFVQFLEYRQ